MPAGDLSSWRARLGSSAVLWTGGVPVDVQADGWLALSGAEGVDYNVAAAYGSGKSLQATFDDLVAADVPAVIMVAGPALGEVQRLVDAGWVCIGARAFMRRELSDPPLGSGAGLSGARRLGPDELGDVRALVGEVYDLTPELAGVAIPDNSVRGVDRAVWGYFHGSGPLTACLAAVRVQDAVVIWSMATAPASRQHGHGRTLIEAALSAAAADGARECLLHSSAEGESLYRDLGFEEIERWQMWSRPRWVLGRA